MLAHAALRRVLGGHLELDPRAVRYEIGVHGKPRLARDLPALEFSLAHADALGLIAVAWGRPLGVDVECLRPFPDALKIAEDQFAPAEARALRALAPADRDAAFLRIWTRKEAVLKAEGRGLDRPLDSLEVDLAPGSASALRRIDGRSGAAAGWVLRDLAAPTGYIAAGAVRRDDGPVPDWRADPVLR